MKKSETGAGQVGLLWVVFLVVLVLGLAGFTYIAWKDKADQETALKSAQKAADDAQKKFEAKAQMIIDISGAVGFRDEDIELSPTSKMAIEDRMTILREKFSDHISETDTTLAVALDKMVDAYDALERQLNESRQTAAQELDLRRQAEGTINTIQDDMNQRIQELETQLSDEQQRAQAQLDEDNERINNLQAQLDEANNSVREAESRLAAAVETNAKEMTMLNARIAAQAKKLEALREPEKPDGRVVGSMTGSDLVYIDIGRQDGLRMGTKFEVYRHGKGGELLPKGWVEVRRVDKDTAMCGIVDTFDQFDPIVKGDVVVNPHFARNLTKTFVFLGVFPPSMNRGFVRERLMALGADVNDIIDSGTDFLVLGDKEQGEFAVELQDTPEFKLATQLGIQLIRLKELAEYIKY